MSYKTHDSLLAYLGCMTNPEQGRSVLDLACGSGRSGLKLTQEGIPVVFADRSTTALEGINRQLLDNKQTGQIWQIDLEKNAANPLANRLFRAIICFRYLHRPLIPDLLKAVEPGGLIIYETFTSDNLRFGRPGNPDFLLEPGELKSWFHHWDVIHYYEGTQKDPDRAIAQLVARNPVVS